MLIGFDVSQTGAGRAGCGSLAHGLLSALAEQDGENAYILYPHFGDLYWEPRPKACLHPAGMRLGPRFRLFTSCKAFWNAPGPDFEARLGSPDIVHANNFFCPRGLTRARLVYTLHDLSFFEEPDWSTEANRTGCLDGVFGAARLADGILANSRFTLEHFRRYFPHYPAERMAVMHLASRFGPDSPERPPAKLAGIEPESFWLSVGTIEPRKNQARLFEALARLPGNRPLVLAGGRGWLMEDVARKVAELGLAGRVRLTGYVDDAELAWLYRHCFGFAYPSLFEGFGLPVLEAMSLGAAVVTSNASALPEVAGDAAVLADPRDPAAIAAGLAALEADPGLRQGLKARGLARARQFSWANAARTALAAYAQTAAMPRFAGGVGPGATGAPGLRARG